MVSRTQIRRGKALWLPKLASGKVIGSVALTDGNDRWAPGDWSLERSDGKLTGRKSGVAKADRAGARPAGSTSERKRAAVLRGHPLPGERCPLMRTRT
jgi:hypothetical protein